MTSDDYLFALRTLCGTSFKAFVKQFWRCVSNDEFVPGYHIDAITDHLQALAKGDITRLIINVAVRHSKSLLTSVFYPAWLWIHKPETRIISATYNVQLTTRDAVRSRQLVESDLYQQCFGDVFKLSDDQSRKDYYTTDHKGHRLSVSIGSRTSGYDADVLIVDDLHDFASRNSTAERNTAIDYFITTLQSRLVYGNDRIVMAGHRVHEDDVYARLKAEGGDDWTWLVLPEEANPSFTNAFPNHLNWKDQRQEGDLLWPDKFSAKVVEQEKKKYRHEYSAVFQQEPTPQEGTLFHPDWFQQRYTETDTHYQLGSRQVPKSDVWKFTTTDLAIGLKTGNDYTVIADWVGWKGHLLLTNLYRARIDGTKIIPTIAARYRAHGSSFVVVEDVAYQRMVIDQLKAESIPTRAYRPDGDKETRSIAAQVMAEAGRLWLPASATWTTDFVREVLAFPNGKHDDQVDVLSLACVMSGKFDRGKEPPEELTPEQRQERAQEERAERFRQIVFAGLPFAQSGSGST